jgi:transposase
VVALRNGGKNDTADAEAILAWHSVREGWKEEHTALLNRVRGLLAEFGVVVSRSADRLLPALPKPTIDDLPASFISLVL